MPVWAGILVIFGFFGSFSGLVMWLAKRQDKARDIAKDNELIAKNEHRRAEDAEAQRDVQFHGSERDLVERMLNRARGSSEVVPHAANDAGNGGSGDSAHGSR